MYNSLHFCMQSIWPYVGDHDGMLQYQRSSEFQASTSTHYEWSEGVKLGYQPGSPTVQGDLEVLKDVLKSSTWWWNRGGNSGRSLPAHCTLCLALLNSHCLTWPADAGAVSRTGSWRYQTDTGIGTEYEVFITNIQDASWTIPYTVYIGPFSLPCRWWGQLSAMWTCQDAKRALCQIRPLCTPTPYTHALFYLCQP
jgi:hypothetical protein